MINFDVFNKTTGQVQFTAELDCDEKEDLSTKLGLAVKWGVENEIDLRDANLSHADLSYCNLELTDLSGVNLSHADLSYCSLAITDLSGVDLSYANLSHTNLAGANLRSANLSSAEIYYANMRCVDLDSANLAKATICYTALNFASLKNANLDLAKLHYTNFHLADLDNASLRLVDLHCSDLGAILSEHDFLIKDSFKHEICPKQGEFQAWKKLTNGHVALIKIPNGVTRFTIAGTRKCITTCAEVFKIYDCNGTLIKDNVNFKLKFDDIRGVSFFMTLEEALMQ